MREVDLLGIDLDSDENAPVLLLRERAEPRRVLPLTIGRFEAASIAAALSGEPPPRPLTHDLLANVIDALEGTVDHVEITKVDKGALIADVILLTAEGRQWLDARPSDALALAVHFSADVLVSDQVLDQAGMTVTVRDEDSIDAEVDEFRTFLDHIEPDDFRRGHPFLGGTDHTA